MAPPIIDYEKERIDAKLCTDNKEDESKNGATSMSRDHDDESPSPPELICFLEFRRSTIRQYPTLNWLGPSVMAVYWFKEYLNKPSFGWIRCPIQHNGESRKKQEKLRKPRKQKCSYRRRTNSKGNFYFIPGQYLKVSEQKNNPTATTQAIAMKNVLDAGTPGTHYATSYIGVYNLLRSYGRFAIKTKDNGSGTSIDSGVKRRAALVDHVEDGIPNVIPLDYNGPPLP